jgi:hypothetical protein
MVFVNARDIGFRGCSNQPGSVEAARCHCRRATSMVFAQ